MLNGYVWPMVPSEYLVLPSKARVDHVVCWMSIWRLRRRGVSDLDLTRIGKELQGGGSSVDNVA